MYGVIDYAAALPGPKRKKLCRKFLMPCPPPASFPELFTTTSSINPCAASCIIIMTFYMKAAPYDGNESFGQGHMYLTF